MGEGPRFVIDRGPRRARDDLDHTEANGRIDGGDPDEVSATTPCKRGGEQCGTLGSGNHFLEVQVVDPIFDEDVAEGVRAGAEPGLRDDPLRQPRPRLPGVRRRAGAVPQRPGEVRHRPARPPARLCPGRSARRGRSTSPRCGPPPTSASATGNCSCSRPARCSPTCSAGRGKTCGMDLLYDVAHNIAKLEEHTVDGKKKKVWVHRKGATRAFPAGPSGGAGGVPRGRPAGHHPRRHGPGVAGCWSAQPGSMEQTFGTTCHGAGRAMSRTAAVEGRRRPADRQGTGSARRDRDGAQPARASRRSSRRRTRTWTTWSNVVHEADLSRKVARMRPIGVIKG